MALDLNHKQLNNTTTCVIPCFTSCIYLLAKITHKITLLWHNNVLLQDVFAFLFPQKNMLLCDCQVGKQRDTRKSSSGLKQKRPFSKVWNSSQSPTCFQPLHVFVYSNHGEETFLQPAAHCKTRTCNTTTEQTDSVPFQLNSQWSSPRRARPGFLHDVMNSSGRSTERHRSRCQP